ncbi:nuclease S1 [Aspergillus nomiae NRRL 13137]|uniref:Nuclease S1 n=1 Tax=Aspergillus nomiae NRRL (strain ATCC 15546 / NRRL 13137 / CBS 260.88 / M93) TaxID=1509407 RepID=A0A0L1J9R4_ASPN3|nr:nuclease S1 [Aspergillus nomiae NRRL 13137]KNG88531.1 nuclease S1 [Aspergillus nomiae NRRL 13137]
MPRLLSITAATLALAQFSHGWGNLGHETVAYIAQSFVASSTESFCQKILGDDSTSYLANVATWADSYKYTAAGAFSKPYHFIDAQDNPPKSCGVDYDRDCGSAGCSISAIQNYTNILLQSPTGSGASNALKFIVHIIGDTHQPLHDENLEAGGNGIDVTYNGEATNLHHIWDSNMPEEAAGGYSLSVAKSYADILTERIKTGAYSSKKDSWTNGIDIKDPVATSMIWAADANTYVCSTVLNDGLAYINSTDLSGKYYDKSQPVFEELIAKAGYRLAAWLDLIAKQSS